MKSHDPDMNKVSLEVTTGYPGKYLGYHKGGGAEPPNENGSARNYEGIANQNQPCKRKTRVVGKNI